ncbi:MAG: hypothetical protein FVQ81_13110 [Candidatus Glassbacteria bacterium]|nr:hypothetical protein [Candidatus Glassbacteria bacterium]
MNTYSISIHLLYREDGSVFEKSVSTEYMASGDREASLAAIWWAEDRLQNLRDAFGAFAIGAIKVHRYHISTVEGGQFQPAKLGFGYVLEWKCDWGYSLEQLKDSLSGGKETGND